MRARYCRGLVLAAALITLLTPSAALQTSDAGVTAEIPHDTYACSPSCTIPLTITNAGDLNGTLDAFTVRTTLPLDARVSLHYQNRTGHYVPADTGNGGDTLTASIDTFWNRTPADSASTAYTYRFRLEVEEHTGHGPVNVTPVIDTADADAVTLRLRPQTAVIAPVAPANDTSPDTRSIEFRATYTSPSHETATCGLYYDEARVRQEQVANASAASFTYRIPGTSPATWRAWCDWNRDNATTGNELSDTRVIEDRTPPTMTLVSPSSPVRFRYPGALIEVTATDAFTGVDDAMVAVEADGRNYTIDREAGTTAIPRFEDTDTFNRSIDVSAFAEGEHTLWVWVSDGAGNRRVISRPAVVDLLTATADRYWNRALPLNMTMDNTVYVCSPTCTATITISAANGTLPGATLTATVTPDDEPPNMTVRRDHMVQSITPGTPFSIDSFIAPDGATARIPVRFEGNTAPRRLQLTLDSDTLAPSDDRGPATVTPWIDDIRVLQPANNTDPDDATFTFAFTYDSRRTTAVPCRVIHSGGRTDPVTAQPGQRTTFNATLTVRGTLPLRWKIGCDADADDTIEDVETGAWHWFNDTIAPSLTVNFPRTDGETFRGPIPLGVTAADNLALATVDATIENMETGDPIVDGRALDPVSADTFNESVANLAPGDYRIIFRAVDAASHTTTRERTVTVPEPQGLLPDWVPSMNGTVNIGALLGVLVVIAIVLGIGGYAYLRSQVDY